MGLGNWLKNERNGEDLWVATFLLLDMITINILLSFFTSYMNHPANYFSWIEAWFILLPGIIIIPILLIALIIFQIKLTRKGYIQKILKNMTN